MSASVLKRSGSFLIDLIIILAIITLIYRLFAQNIIQAQVENFDPQYQEFLDAQIERTDEILALQEALSNGEITEANYQSELVRIDAFYNDNYVSQTEVFVEYILLNIVYFLTTYLIINYLYQLLFKGQTIGRRMLKIRITGRVTWWNLLFREVFWKGLYWVFTFGFGIFLDFILIAFTTQRKTIRDYITQSRIINEDTLYPI
jgi:hypothetical protein